MTDVSAAGKLYGLNAMIYRSLERGSKCKTDRFADLGGRRKPLSYPSQNFPSLSARWRAIARVPFPIFFQARAGINYLIVMHNIATCIMDVYFIGLISRVCHVPRIYHAQKAREPAEENRYAAFVLNAIVINDPAVLFSARYSRTNSLIYFSFAGKQTPSDVFGFS